MLCFYFEWCKSIRKFPSEKYPVVTERLREKCVAHKCRLRRTIFLPFLFVWDFFFIFDGKDFVDYAYCSIPLVSAWIYQMIAIIRY